MRRDLALVGGRAYTGVGALGALLLVALCGLSGAAWADAAPPRQPRGGAAYDALITAAEKDDVSGVRAAIARGADTEFCWGEGPEPALYEAARAGSARVVEFLLQIRPELVQVLCTRRRFESSVLHAALEGPRYGEKTIPHERRMRILQLLIQYHAPLEARGSARTTPLQMAIEMGNLDVIRLLLNAGANIRATSYFSKLQALGPGYTAADLAKIGNAAVMAELKKRIDEKLQPARPQETAPEVPPRTRILTPPPVPVVY